MSGPVFVKDAQGRPLMPISAAHARKLVHHGKAAFAPHHAFTVLQLAQTIDTPHLRPIILGITLHRTTAELMLIAEGTKKVFSLLHITIDLNSDLSRRLRRRAEHRRRRRQRGRYRQPAQYGVPFKLRRPNMHLSAWSRQLRRTKKSLIHKPSASNPVVSWRVEAIQRVIAKLQQLAPISHAVILSPLSTTGPTFIPLRPSERRQKLIQTYGVQDDVGVWHAVCGYCGTMEGTIEVDHIVPQSAGGSNYWQNLTLACSRCNTKKGGRTPEAAGMELRRTNSALRSRSDHTHPMIRHTAKLLYKNLLTTFHRVTWQRTIDERIPDLSADTQSLLAIGSPGFKLHTLYIAKPVARTRKQVYTGRNYPFSTPLTSSFIKLRHTIKRRVRVNRGLVILHQLRRCRIHVIPEGEPIPQESGLFIERGMFFEGRRADEVIRGIVGAIHSTGRITLLVPEHVSSQGIRWKKVVVSPRSHYRLLSTEKVIFMPVE